MCSHENITWTITDNSVTDRMLENSLIHKFRPSRKIRKSTKLLNTKIKKHCGVKDYKHYVELKTNVIRNLVKDTDTSDSSSLSDVDYDIIYNSSSKRAKYKARSFQNYVSIRKKDYEGCNRRIIIHKKKSRGRSTEKKVQVRRSLRLNPAVSEECINTDWQEVTNKNNSVSRKRSHTNISNNKKNILKDNDRIHLKAQSSKQSLSSQFDSQIDSASSIIKSGNKYVRRNHEDFDVIDNKLSSEDNMISNKTKPVSKRKVQNKKNQSAIINENIELNSHGLHYYSLPQSISLENNTNSDNELNSLVKSKDDVNESTAVIESSINSKNCDSVYMNHKSKLLKNVKRNLIIVLEKVDSMNNSKNATDKNIGGELSYDQLLPDIVNFDRHHSTPLKKIQTNVPNKDLSSDVLQDQQKDSGIDEDLEDRLVKIKKSNKTPMSQNMEKNANKILISSLELNKIDEALETMEDSEEVVKDPRFNDILREQINKEERTPSGEEKMENSSQLNQIDMNVETNEQDEHFVKAKDSSDILKQQLLSPKQDCMKEAHSKPCSLIQEEEDGRIVKIPAEKEEEDISLQLKEDNAKVDVEVPSINHKGKIIL